MADLGVLKIGPFFDKMSNDAEKLGKMVNFRIDGFCRQFEIGRSKMAFLSIFGQKLAILGPFLRPGFQKVSKSGDFATFWGFLGKWPKTGGETGYF